MTSDMPKSFRLELLRWGRSVGGFYKDKPNERSVWLTVLAHSWTDEDEFVLSNGEHFYRRDFRLVVRPGEPLLQDGTRIQGGGGVLSYVPAYRGEHSHTDSAFDARVHVDEACFADICRLLPAMATGGYECDLRMAVVGPGFRMPDTHIWNVEDMPNLVVSSFDFGITSIASPLGGDPL